MYRRALDSRKKSTDIVFAEVVDIRTPVTPNTSPSVTFDPEWLAITRALHPYLSLGRHQRLIPRTEELKSLVDIERAWVKQNLPNGGLIEISQVQQFVPTAPGPQPGQHRQQRKTPNFPTLA